ncbi:ABC transporter substrate-binding protein [Jatrophihabitans lederbergiae]|uniref:ABC transporter substrate-binding protein n=1 Tax=Jatrophihabitans lederbergiae TaxID=3075547 RepID=A0ABU2JAJ7_9ACTN|nr:ABC transporter substrate-binding protein [Jatrophihabitans sp. DSM 44399]MDT0261669.1 ABC transporter substrate-binding protein [Jatrophihabitans sp. DSM 44399]
MNDVPAQLPSFVLMPDTTGAEVPQGISRRSILGVGASVAAATLLAACGGGKGAGGSTGSKSSTLTVGIPSTPDTLDPGATGLALTLLMAFTMFDPLVWWLPDGSNGAKFVPGLATSYSVNKDATVFNFKLRKDVTFHDGTKFDATAVKATFDHVVDPATKSKSGLGALGPYKETQIVSPYEVNIVFSSPNASFLHQQAAGNFGIASPTALSKYGAVGFGNHPVGTGPFKFSRYVSGDRLTVVRNPDYKWGPSDLGTAGPPALESVIFRVITDDSGRYNGLQSGQTQVAMNLPPNTINVAKAKYDQLTVPSIGTPIGLMINVTKEPTDDPKVRQAILYAVDQETLVKSVLFGTSTAAHGVLTPTTPGYSKPGAALYSYDPDKANALLDSAGWVKGSDGTRSKNGKKLQLEILLYSGAGMELPTQFVVSQLAKVGFAANTSVQPFATAQGSFNNGVHNLGSFGYFGMDPYLLNIWVNSNAIKTGFNWSHYTNKAIDAEIAKANATADDTARNAMYTDIGTKLMQDGVFLPLYDVTFAFTMSKKLSGVKTTLNGYVLFHGAKLG